MKSIFFYSIFLTIVLNCTTNPDACKSKCSATLPINYQINLDLFAKSCTTSQCVSTAQNTALISTISNKASCESQCDIKETKKNPLNLPF